jgi:hypothetical protein
MSSANEVRRVCVWGPLLLCALLDSAPAFAGDEDIGPLYPGGPDSGGMAPAAPTPASDYAQPQAEARLWLRVRATHASDGGERQRSVGMLELGGHFDGLLGTAAFDPGPASADPVFLAESPSPRATAPTLAALVSDRGALGASPAAELTPALSQAVVTEALRVLEARARSGRLDTMASRARAAASLPEVRLGAGTSRDESLRFAPTLDDPARFTRDGGRDLWFEARLTWQLDRAIFSRDEIAIERIKADAEKQRHELTRDVVEALIDWQRARYELTLELVGSAELAAARLRELSALARLDVLTEGWFSRWLARRSKPLRQAAAGPRKRGSLAALVARR